MVSVLASPPCSQHGGDFLRAFIGLHQLRFGALEQPAHFADILALRPVHAALPVADGGLVDFQLLSKVDLQKPRLFTVCSNRHFFTSKAHKNEFLYWQLPGEGDIMNLPGIIKKPLSEGLLCCTLLLGTLI